MSNFKNIALRTIKQDFDLHDPSYTPVHLLEKLQEFFDIKTDYKLAQIMLVELSTISKVRNRKDVVSAGFIVRAADLTGWSVEQIRSYAGLPKEYLPWKSRLKPSAPKTLHDYLKEPNT